MRSFGWITLLAFVLLVCFFVGQGRNTAALVATWIFFPGVVVLYFCPGVVASSRKHKNEGSIWVMTLLLGWTVLGWIIALIWAYSGQATDSENEGASPMAEMKKCPFCAEEIRAEAVLCKHCRSPLGDAAAQN